jgi:hypothetical protein
MRPAARKFKGRRRPGRVRCAVHAATHNAGANPAARFRANQCGERGRLRSAWRAFIHDPHRVAAGLLVRAQGEQAALLAVGQ